MTTAQVVETSVTVNNSPIQDYVNPDDQTQPTFEMTPGFKPFTKDILPDDLPQSVSVSAADINITVRAVSAGVLRCNLAESNSVLKVCISKHCHELTGFLLWIATRCIGCIVEVVVKSKGFIFSGGI